jgi:predicted GTPase
VVGTDLDVAVAAAVADGLEVVDVLAAKVIDVLDRCVEAADRAIADHSGLHGVEVVEAYRDMAVVRKAEAERRFGRQRDRLSTFNLVLFGRTGAGKSSLIEALSSGDGEPISQGESDWTTDVREVHWRGSRLIDTPGIGGWGRTTSRTVLEARAEDAVADADVVILCFDTQSQQAGEFSKIAEWVSWYGKPVVAVLNSRNARWRQPLKVERQATRRDLSRTVLEHAGNIRDELDRIGLSDVPIVAIHTKRAAFARTQDPYSGPDATGRQRQRNDYGPEQLLAWSNLPALEQLLAEALQQHAAPLRLGMLHEQARGLLAETEARVQIRRNEASALAGGLEHGIREVLELVGRPADEDLEETISRLEALRGSFGTIGPGELITHARHRLAAALEQAKVKAFRRADRLIDQAFEAADELSHEQFEREVLGPAREEAEAAARSVGSELQLHLAQRLALVADDVRSDLRAAVSTFDGTDTTMGRSLRSLGVALETSSGLLTAGSGGALLAAAVTAWNPAGWVLGSIAGVSVLGGLALTSAGGRVRRRAARQRVSAISDARAKGRRAVHETFERLEQLISEDHSRILAQAAHERLADDVAEATALRLVSIAGGVAAADLRETRDQVPEDRDTRHLISDIARDLQRRHFPGDPAADRLLWLGEDWCTEPHGLAEADADLTPVPVGPDPAVHAHLLARVQSVVGSAAARPSSGAGTAWLATTLDWLSDDDETLSAISPLEGVADGTTPRIVLAGDYSTGKSSLIKRLLVDSGLEVPDALNVAARPATGSARAFHWAGWQIVDTPGFQSSNEEHASIAHQGVVGASLLIVLFNPNLVVGGAADLLTILLGDRAAGRVGMLPRTLFVINRSDELGVDPRDDPVGYRNLCRRKELELVQALESLHRDSPDVRRAISAAQVLCVASDPYGVVGDRSELTRSDYDQHRDWDGMDAMHDGLAESGPMLAANAVDIQILENGAVALANLVAARRERLEAIEAEVAQRRLLLLDLDACLSAGGALRASSRDRLASACVSHVAGLFDEIAGMSHDDELRDARVEQLRNWAESPEVQQLFAEWSDRFARDQEDWQEATSARVEARLTSTAFTSAFSAKAAPLDVDDLESRSESVVRDVAVDGARGLAQGAMNVSRESVTKAVHALGGKFRPWGATKLTAKINKAGGALGIALGVAELYGVYRSVRREREDELSTSDRRTASLQMVRQAAEAFFDGTGLDAPGRVMDEAIDQVQQFRADEAACLAGAEAEVATLAGWIERCETRIQAAFEQLEEPEP